MPTLSPLCRVLCVLVYAVLHGVSPVYATAPQANDAPIKRTAPTKQIPQTQMAVQMSYAPLVQKTTPAVVNIYAKKLVTSAVSPFGGDAFFQQFFGGAFPKQYRQRLEQSLGSGVIVRADGLIVTNHHVIEQAQDIRVMLSDRREYSAKIVLTDKRTDLAIIRLQNAPKNLPYLTLANSDHLQVGDLVMAIGNPFGVGQTVTTGVVSALARTGVGVGDFRSFIQTDAAINPGNSGGALVNMWGELVGINTAIISRSGGSQGIGYAVPSDMVNVVIQAGATGKKLVRGWLGLVGQDITYESAQALGLDRTMGVLVEDMHPNSPFKSAGVQQGDVIVSAGGRRVDDFEVLRYAVGSKSVGGKLPIHIFRNGKIYQRNIALISAPEIPPANTWEIGNPQSPIGMRTPFAGLVVRNINPAFADKNYINPLKQGVIVVAIKNGSVAEQVGFKTGDIIHAINDKKSPNIKTLKSILNLTWQSWKLTIERDDEFISVTLN